MKREEKNSLKNSPRAVSRGKKKTFTEITAFSDRAAEFEKLNTQILGVSVDSQFSHLAWIQTDRKEGGVGEFFV